jgi:acyl transferase domain-containing protein
MPAQTGELRSDSGWLIFYIHVVIFLSFAKAEGAVVFVLKPLDAALADHDHIYSVVCCQLWLAVFCCLTNFQVLGSAINSNGARAPLHAPSEVAQQECIRAAYRDAGRDPKDVDFIELHATGNSFEILIRLSSHD